VHHGQCSYELLGAVSSGKVNQVLEEIIVAMPGSTASRSATARWRGQLEPPVAQVISYCDKDYG